MTNLLKEHSALLLKETENLTELLKAYPEPADYPAEIFKRHRDYSLEDIEYHAVCIQQATEKMGLTYEEWRDEQVDIMLYSVDLDRREVQRLLGKDEKITGVGEMIKAMLNRTKYKGTDYQANFNDVRTWLLVMIKAFNLLADRGVFVFDEDFNTRIHLPLERK